MAEFTKKAIRNSFIKLLNEKPLKQITVRDIVDDCGVNRNTFYYHFQDIPQLIETIIQDYADQVILEHPAMNSVEEYVDTIIGFALKNRNAVLHIYRSVNRDIYEQYQWRVCEHTAKTFVNQLLEGCSADESDRKILIDYIKCVCFGIVMGWLEEGMQTDIRPYAHRLFELKQGDLDLMIQRFKKI